MGNTPSSFLAAYKQLGRTPPHVNTNCGVLCSEVGTILKHVLAFSAALTDDRVKECRERDGVQQFVSSDVGVLNALLLQEKKEELQHLVDKAAQLARTHCKLGGLAPVPQRAPAKQVLLRMFGECCQNLERRLELTDTLRAEMDCCRSLQQQHARLHQAQCATEDEEARQVIECRLETIATELAQQEREVQRIRAASLWDEPIHDTMIVALRAIFLLQGLLPHANFYPHGVARVAAPSSAAHSVSLHSAVARAVGPAGETSLAGAGSLTLGTACLALSYATLIRTLEKAAELPAARGLSDDERCAIFERLPEGLRDSVVDALRHHAPGAAGKAIAGNHDAASTVTSTQLKEILTPLSSLALRTFQYSEGKRLDGFSSYFAAETLYCYRLVDVEMTLRDALICLHHVEREKRQVHVGDSHAVHL